LAASSAFPSNHKNGVIFCISTSPFGVGLQLPSLSVSDQSNPRSTSKSNDEA